jgi:predicted nucleic acid-binding Zn ribbon protein
MKNSFQLILQRAARAEKSREKRKVFILFSIFLNRSNERIRHTQEKKKKKKKKKKRITTGKIWDLVLVLVLVLLVLIFRFSSS